MLGQQSDHTAYTLDTADGRLRAKSSSLLEHVILPTLTDEGCYTEVHHHDVEGNDAGFGLLRDARRTE